MRGNIPLAAKLAFSAFMAVLVPVYWHGYGPQNFLYFCDLALFFTLAALWLENSLLASMPLVGILVAQAIWQLDFLAHFVGLRIIGVTDYMFNPDNPLFTRSLSFFHFWLPIFLLWIVWRLGYDRRAFWLWTCFAALVLLVCYFCMPPPSADATVNEARNINYVFGFSSQEPQTMTHPLLWLALMVVGSPLVCYLPAHVALRRLFRPPQARG